MIEKNIERIADALEKLVEQNEKLLSGGLSIERVGETATATTPPPAAKAATGKGKAKPAETPPPAAEPEPESEPEGPSATVEEVRATFLQLIQKTNQEEATKVFDAFKAEVGIQKTDEMSGAQRADLKGRFEALIASAI